MTDRFEFEQKLIKFSNVIEDLREVANKTYDQRIMTLADYYDYQFDALWTLFEQMVKEGNIK